MINLLPYEHKRQLSAARTNTLLLRYNLLLLLAVVFLGIAIGLVYLFLTNMQADAERTVTQNTSKEANFNQVKSEATAFQAQLSDAKSLFDNQVLYSKALVRYANLFPDGTAIDSLKIDSNSFTTPTTMTVKVRGEQATRALTQSFESSPFVLGFKRNTISVSTDSEYPYSVEINFQLKKEIAQ